MRILRNGVAGVLIGTVPVASAVAATRPGAAVPLAGSAVSAQVYEDNRRGAPAIAWPAVAVMAAALLVGLWIVLDDDDDGEGALTRG